jgi:NADH:ubiquinone oxidoreductase subunit K
VTYRAGPGETRVDACAARTIAWSSSSLRAERIALIVAAVEVVGIAVLMARWRRKKRDKVTG